MNPSNDNNGWGRRPAPTNDPTDGWGRRDGQNNNNPDHHHHHHHSARPSPRHSSSGGGPPPYNSFGSYSFMGHSERQQRWNGPNNNPNNTSHNHNGAIPPRPPPERCHTNSNNAAATAPLCHFYREGICRHGMSCRFRHERPNENNNSSSRHHSNTGGSNSFNWENDNRSISSDNNYNNHRHVTDARSVSSRSIGSDGRNTSGGQYHQNHHPSNNNHGLPPSSQRQHVNHNFTRSDSNRSIDSGSNADNASSKFWSKINLTEKPMRRQNAKAAAADESSSAAASTSMSPKKTIKWGNNNTKEIQNKNYCNLPGHDDHLWSQCPQNPHAKNKNKTHPAPTLSAEESNALCRAALGNANDYSKKRPPPVDVGDKLPAAMPNTMAKSINSLYGTANNLKNNTLKQPPTVVASKTAGTVVAAAAAAAAQSGVIPRRNSAAAQPLPRKNLHALESAASKLKSAGLLLKTPGTTNHKKSFVPRSQRGLAKRPSTDHPPSPTNKKRKLSTNQLTSPIGRQTMAYQNGGWKKRDVPVAPLGNNSAVVALTKHTSTRLLGKKNNPFDILDESGDDDDDNKEDASHDDDKANSVNENDENEEDCGGTNVEFDSDVEEDDDNNPSDKSPRKESSHGKEQILTSPSTTKKSPEVICIDSSSSSDSESEDEAEKQVSNSESLENNKTTETIDNDGDVVMQDNNSTTSSHDSLFSDEGEQDEGKTTDESIENNSPSTTERTGIEKQQVEAGEETNVEPQHDVDKEMISKPQQVTDEDAITEPQQVADGKDSIELKKSTDEDSSKNHEEIVPTDQQQDAGEKTSLEHDQDAEEKTSNGHNQIARTVHQQVAEDITSNAHEQVANDHQQYEVEKFNLVQRQLTLTDGQIDEMEADLMDWIECLTQPIVPQNANLTDGTLTNDDDSSISDGSRSEDFDDDELDANAQIVQNNNRNSANTPQDSSSRPSSRNSVKISAKASFMTSQRSDASSVTPSPPSGAAIHEADLDDKKFIESTDNNYTEIHTCNKCHLVFDDYNDAETHEETCTSTTCSGPIFHDAGKLCRYIKRCREKSECYYKPSKPQSKAAIQEDNIWDMSYKAVKKFFQDNGNFDLPNESTSELGNLNDWLAEQILAFHRGYIKSNRKKKMSKLLGGEVERKAKIKAENKAWEKRYQAVRKFAKQNGHIHVPNKTAGFGNLSEWLIIQQEKFKEGTLNDKQATKMRNLLGHAAVQVMRSVDHLCTTDLSSGLPKQILVVFDVLTGKLHEFQTEVRPSSIVNSGRGVFLTYLGAKKLKPEASAKSSQLIKHHVAVDNLLHSTLPAVFNDGKRASVTVSPQSLFLNDNHHLWSKKRIKAYEKHMKKKPNIAFDENTVNCKIHQEVQNLRSFIPENERIGELGIHSIADYIDDDSEPFWSYEQIQLGRYGPFRPEDIKPELHLNVKNFLFDYEPNEWAYGLDEDEDKMIDITDDTTGQVHELAQQNSTIYVNEVGHSPDMHENVFIRVKGEAGAVYYYISIDEQHAMKKGDTVELLVNYGEHYEDVRVRKGYGLANAKEGIGGDANDKAARYQRNFVERDQVEQEIIDLNFIKLSTLTEFLTTKVYQPIKKAIDKNLSNSRHIIARRRLHWLALRLDKRLKVLMQKPNPVMTPLLVDRLRKSILEFQFNSTTIPKQTLEGVMSKGNQRVKDAIREEISEEIFYEVSYKAPNSYLPYPMDECHWSKVALSIMSYCAVNLASFMFAGPNTRLALSKAILDGAVESAKAIRKATNIVNRSSQSTEIVDEAMFDRAVSFLAFKSQTVPQNHLVSLGQSAYDICTPLSHREAATLAEIQAYQDAADLCLMGGSKLDPATIASSIDTKITIISKYHFDQPVQDDENAQQFLRMPRTIDAFKRGVAQVHEHWYLLHQVVMVVHAIASFVDWTPNENEDPFYSLEKLCSMIEFDTEIAKAALSRWSNKPISSTARRSPVKARKSVKARTSLSPKTARQICLDTKIKTPSPTPRSSPVESIEQRTIRDGPDEKFPGWNVREIRRATGEHVDRYWYMPEHPDTIVRSQMGVYHIRQIMIDKNMELLDACNYLIDVEGKQTYFHRRKGRGKKRSSPQTSASETFI